MNKERKRFDKRYWRTQSSWFYDETILFHPKAHLLIPKTRIHSPYVSKGDILEKLRKIYNIKGTYFQKHHWTWEFFDSVFRWKNISFSGWRICIALFQIKTQGGEKKDNFAR